MSAADLVCDECAELPACPRGCPPCASPACNGPGDREHVHGGVLPGSFLRVHDEAPVQGDLFARGR